MTRVNKWFVFMAWICGIAFALILPPFQAPDEIHHLYRVVHISDGHLYADKLPSSRLGGEINPHYKMVSDPFVRLRYNYMEKTSRKEIQSIIRSSKAEKEKQFLDFPNVGYYTPISYLPQSVTLWLLSPFQFNGLIELYIIRLISISLWMIILMLCSKIAPDKLSMWLILGTLPATLVTHAGISTDLVTHSMAFIVLAYFFKFLAVEKINYRAWLLYSILILLLSYSRVVFAPFALLGWILPVRIFQGKKHFITLNLTNVLVVLVLLGIQYYRLGDLFIPYDDYAYLFREGKQLNPGVNPSAQLDHILHHPLIFVGSLFASWIEVFPSTMAHYLGKFGWEANYIPTSILVLLAMALLVHFITSPRFIARRVKWLCLGVAAISCLAVSIVLYLQWEPVGAPRITSLSGRYFVGIFPLFFVVLSGIYPRKLGFKYLAVTWVIGWTFMLISMINRYYV